MAATEQAVQDLTARARIRDAAIRLFAEHGFEGTSIRDISTAARVSPGLIRHHFGSKEGLRDACDAHAFAVFRDAKEGALEQTAVANPMFITATYASASPAARYLGRALADDSPAASSLFDDMVSMTHEFLAKGSPIFAPRTDDLAAYAAVLTTMSLGLLVLREHLERVLGGDDLCRLAQAILDIHAHALISEPYAEAMKAGLAGQFSESAANGRSREGR